MEVQACRVCLTTERHLLSLSENNVKTAFEDVIGFTINLNNSLPKQICFVCKARVLSYSKFKKCCQNVQSLLEEKVFNNIQITQDVIKEISDALPQINLNFSETTVTNNTVATNPDFQDIHELIQKKCEPQDFDDFIQSHETSDDIKNTVDSQYSEYIHFNIKNECANETHEGFDDIVFKSDDKFNNSDEICDEKITFYDNIDSNIEIIVKENEDTSEANEIYKNIENNQHLKKIKVKQPNSSKGFSRKTHSNTGNIQLIQLKEVIDKNEKIELKIEAIRKKTVVKRKNPVASSEVEVKRKRTVVKRKNIVISSGVTVKRKKTVAKRKNLVASSKELMKKPVKWSETMTQLNLSKYNMNLRFLNKEEQIQKMLSRKASVKYEKAPFKCELCCKPYMSQRAFARHNTLHQASVERPKQCHLCLVYLSGKQHRVHLRAHRTEITCALCHQEIEPNTTAIRNHSGFHTGVKFECKECDKVYQHYSTYINHKSARHSDTACSLCGECFRGHKGILGHMRKSHTQDSCLQCDICKYYFYNKEALQQHLDTCNTGTSPCGECGVNFGSATELRTHIEGEHRGSTLQMHVCSECGRTFKRETSLIAHWRTYHQGKEYVNMAPRRCTAQSIRSGRGRRVPKTGNTETTNKPKKNCICEQCGEMLMSSCHLRMHMLKHTGEKPHQCDQCDKSFRLIAQLRVHARIHSGEKPYQCSECASAFRQVSHLKGHMRMHTGERPYKCSVCVKAFSLKINRDEHVRTVHEGKPPKRRKKRGIKCLPPLTGD